MRTEPTQANRSPDGAAADEITTKPSVFSEDLLTLMAQFNGQPVQLGTLFEATKGRGYNFLLLLITLPFVTPVPLPGVSIPFGVVVAIVGARMALGQGPWLPEQLLRRQIPASVASNVLPLARRIMRFLEWFLRPRLLFVKNHEIFARIAGILIAVSGLFLLLPLPLPFSNSLPAWTVIFLSAGALGRDGLFFFAGCASFVLSLAYFILIGVAGTTWLEKIGHLLLP